MNSYYVYILQCSDDRYYIGVTNDYISRVAQHQKGMDPTCYTYMRRPVELVYLAEFSEVTDAIAWEKKIKRWSRRKKQALILGDQQGLELAAVCKNATRHGNYLTIACHTERRRSAIRNTVHNAVSFPRLPAYRQAGARDDT